MKSTLLVPHRYKIAGLVLFIPSLFLGIWWRFFDQELALFNFTNIGGKDVQGGQVPLNFTDEIALTGMIAGLLLIAFSREKWEDEYISRIRLESLQWAVILNYVLLIVAAWLVHGWSFIDVMMYNMLTVLILFIVRFHFLLHRNKASSRLN